MPCTPRTAPRPRSRRTRNGGDRNTGGRPRGAVHDRLARAGASGDLGHPSRGCSNGFILMALDGGHDVAHPSAASSGQGRHQRTVTDDHEVVRRLGDHEVVLDADDVGTLAAQHPSAQYAEGLDGCGAIEGRCGRRTPVDHQRLVVTVSYTHLTLPTI